MFSCVLLTQVYTRYRFLQRETRWKGLEDSLDECIDESMRTLDQVRDLRFIILIRGSSLVHSPSRRTLMLLTYASAVRAGTLGC